MNNNDSFEEAKRIIAEAQRFRPIANCCFPANNSGATGPTGPTGNDGETPTLTIGTVTTGAPGTEADAEITGDAPNFVLNLTIPQGSTGPAGENA